MSLSVNGITLRVVVVFSVLLLLTGCSGSSKKVYQPLKQISQRIDVEPVWVTKVGPKLLRQHRQLGFELDDNKVYVADAAGEIKVLDTLTGDFLWEQKYKLNISTSPTIGTDSIFIGTNDAEVLALDKENGKVRWKVKVSSEVLSSPVIAGEKLIVQTIDGKITALNIKNGSRIWVESEEVPALTLRGTSSPMVNGNKIVAGFASGKLVAFDMESGKQLWDTSIAVPRGRTDLQRMVDIDGVFEGQGDEVYAVSYQGRVAAISAQTGRSIWARDMSSFNGLVLDSDQIFLTDSDDNVWALDRRTGATVWRQDALADRNLSGPAIMGNFVVVADGAGYLHWLSREDGSFAARRNLQQAYDKTFHDWGGDEPPEERRLAVTTPLVVAGNHLYVRDNEGALTVYTIKSAKN